MQRARVKPVTRRGSVSVLINVAAASWHSSDNDAQKVTTAGKAYALNYNEAPIHLPCARFSSGSPLDLLTSWDY